MTRVVVTGMGTVNPLGNDVVEFKENLFAGKLGIAPITKFDTCKRGLRMPVRSKILIQR